MKQTKKLSVLPSTHLKLSRIKQQTGISIVRLLDSAAEHLAEKYGVKAPRARRKPATTTA